MKVDAVAGWGMQPNSRLQSGETSFLSGPSQLGNQKITFAKYYSGLRTAALSALQTSKWVAVKVSKSSMLSFDCLTLDVGYTLALDMTQCDG